MQLDNDFIAETMVVARDLEARDRVKARLEGLREGLPRCDRPISRLELGPPWARRCSTGSARRRRKGAAPRRGSRARPSASGLVSTVNYDSAEKSKELRVGVDQDRVRQAGLSSKQLAQALNGVISGSTVTELATHLSRRHRRPRQNRRAASVEALRNLQITTPTGASVPLRELARFEYELDKATSGAVAACPRSPFRRNRCRAWSRASCMSKSSPPSTICARPCRPGTLLETGGTVDKSAESNAALLAQVPLMIALMLTVLMLQLGSFRRMALVISVAPLGLIGVVAALLSTGTPMGFIATLGIIALAGMIIRNSVILIDQIEHERARGVEPWQAVVDAAMHRFRPIMLTAAAAILGMIPIMHDVFWGPMAYAIVGGLAVATALTLVFLPALYVTVNGIREPDEAPAALDAIAVSGLAPQHDQRAAVPQRRRLVPFLRLDPIMPAQNEAARDYADKMLLSALEGAHASVRFYDTKAQIVGAGYILALNVVLHFGDLLPNHAPIGPLFFAAVWLIVIMPIIQFGHVLYPSRTRADRELVAKTSDCSGHPHVYHVDPDRFANVGEFVEQALKSDWTSVVAAELLKTSRVRIIKQARFRRGLMMTAVSFLALGGEQFCEALPSSDENHADGNAPAKQGKPIGPTCWPQSEGIREMNAWVQPGELLIKRRLPFECTALVL